MIDLLYFKGKIKRSSFYLKPKEKVDNSYNLDTLVLIYV